MPVAVVAVPGLAAEAAGAHAIVVPGPAVRSRLLFLAEAVGKFGDIKHLRWAMPDDGILLEGNQM